MHLTLQQAHGTWLCNRYMAHNFAAGTRHYPATSTWPGITLQQAQPGLTMQQASDSTLQQAPDCNRHLILPCHKYLTSIGTWLYPATSTWPQQAPDPTLQQVLDCNRHLTLPCCKYLTATGTWHYPATSTWLQQAPDQTTHTCHCYRHLTKQHTFDTATGTRPCSWHLTSIATGTWPDILPQAPDFTIGISHCKISLNQMTLCQLRSVKFYHGREN